MWKPGWDWPVDVLIQFSSTVGVTMRVSSGIWLKLVQSEFVGDSVDHVGLFFVAQKAGAQRFIVDAS